MPTFSALRRALSIFSWPALGWLLGLLPLGSLAQSFPVLRGTVADERGRPLELATVTLHRAADSVAVKTEFSDAQGRFELPTKPGKFLVSAAQVGYARAWYGPVDVPLPGQPYLEPAPNIVLKTSAATALNEVTVTGRRALYEHTAAGTTVNVADNPLSAGGTALDVLGRSPGMTVDAGGNLALRGRQGLLVVIDGRRTPLAGAELADYLRSLPAEQVQNLEILTSPPAQYDAQGGAGVLVINLKKDQRLGTNGSLNASYGQGRYGKFVGGLSLNNRGRKYNLYGSYTYADRQYFTNLDFTRDFAAQPGRLAAHSILSSYQTSHLRSHAAKLGLDLNLSKRTLLGVSAGTLLARTASHTDNQTWFYDELLTINDRFRSVNDQTLWRPSFTANVNFRHAFADSATARSLSLDADVARYHTSRLNDLATYPDAPAVPVSQLHGDQGNTLVIRAAKVDFGQPLPHRLRLEAGAKSTLITSDNNVTFVRDGQVDGAISQPFTYRENVNAAYASLRGALAGLSGQLGLRVENTNLRAEQGALLLRERSYTQLFPSLLLERQLNKNNSLAFSVSRRIDRPSYNQLNPLRAYLDATSYSAGNPDLVAQTSLNLELSHTYQGKFTTALAYARTDQPIVNVVQPSPDGGYLVVNRFVNLTTQHFYTLTLTAPLTPAKWWQLYFNGLLYYNHFVGTLADTYLDRGRVAAQFTINNSLTLPHGWSAELNGLYESREVYGFRELRDRGQLSLGLQKSLWNKQGTLRLSVTDVLYTTPERATSTYATFQETYRSAQDLRVATLAFTYRFGNGKVAAARRRAAGADEELRRAGGQ